MTNGPYETERQVREIPAVQAVWTAFRAAPGVGAMEPHNRSLIEDACRAARVELGAYDARIVAWLAGWEPQTCAVIAGLIRRARPSVPLAAELRSLADSIGRRLADEHADRQQIAEDAAGRLRDLATILAVGAAPVAALDAVQLETVLDALADAAEYRYLHSTASCEDCNRLEPARCADHTRDEKASASYDALARQLREEARR